MQRATNLLFLCALVAVFSAHTLHVSAGGPSAQTAVNPPSAPATDAPVPADACELPKDQSCLVPAKPPAGSCIGAMRSLVAGKNKDEKARYARYVCGVQPGASRKMMFGDGFDEIVDKFASSCRAVAFAILRLHGYEYTPALMNGYPTSCGDATFKCMSKQFYADLEARIAKKQSTLIHLRVTDARVGEDRLKQTVTIGHHVIVEMTFSPSSTTPEFVILQAFEDFHTLDEWLYPCTFNRKWFCSFRKTVPKPKEVNQIVDLMKSPWAAAKVFDMKGMKPYFENLEALHTLLAGFNGKKAEDGIDISCDAIDKPYSSNFAVSIKQFAPQGKCRLVPPAYPKGSEPPYLGVFYRLLDYKLDRCKQTVEYIKGLPKGKQCVADPVDKNLVDICV